MKIIKKIIIKLIKLFIKLIPLFNTLKVPDNKKYLVFIKIAKTGGSTIVDYFHYNTGVIYLRDFEKLSYNKKIINRKLIVIVNDQIHYFITNYNNFWKNSYKFSCVRNPIARFESSMNYHPYCINKEPINLIKSLSKYSYSNIYDWKNKFDTKTKIKISAYNHLLFSQYESLFINNKKLFDYLIYLEKFNFDFIILLKKLNLGFYFKNLYKKNINLNKQKKILSNDEIKYIKKYFKKDFLNFYD
jgi:hypothetical protein